MEGKERNIMQIEVIISIIPQTPLYIIKKQLVDCKKSQWEIIRINCMFHADK